MFQMWREISGGSIVKAVLGMLFTYLFLALLALASAFDWMLDTNIRRIK